MTTGAAALGAVTDCDAVAHLWHLKFNRAAFAFSSDHIWFSFAYFACIFATILSTARRGRSGVTQFSMKES